MAKNKKNQSRYWRPRQPKASEALGFDPSMFFNRELSWLEFNRRVLDEAKDATVPLLERLKFIAIFASNLDEFFMVRMAALKQKMATGISATTSGDRMLPRNQHDQCVKVVSELIAEANRCLKEEILSKLSFEGVSILERKELNDEEKTYLDKLFRDRIFPVLTPLAVDPSHPFPRLQNNSLNLAIRLRRPADSSMLFAMMQVPAVLPRFCVLPDRQGHQLLPLENVIRKHLHEVFPGMEIVDSFVFRVTRDNDLDLDDFEEINDLKETIERQIRERRRGDATRLEIEKTATPEVVEFLRESVELDASDIFISDSPIDPKGLFEIYDLPGYEWLRYPEYVPRLVPAIAKNKSLWSAIKEEDILVHHPYDSFKPVVDFINAAADDPQVLAIKQTLYRTSSDSPIIRALQRAADCGKQVTALVELQARLDEERNIQWARMLEETGVHVVYGFVGIKTHCKVALVVRSEEDGIRRYVHLATGNYNSLTARVYTDIGVFTCDADFGEDVSALFNYLTGYSELPSWKKLVLAPSRLFDFIIEMINEEAKLGPKGRIVAKLNAVLEPRVIEALYRASQAGVRIDLICRGICALRPGIAGVSENIRVISIVDRFLEHSRIFYFGCGGTPRVYISSADWMDRNLLRRIEAAVPIENNDLKLRLIEILAVCLTDNVKARKLNSDGTWVRVQPEPGAPLVRAQQYFLDMGPAEDGRVQLTPPPESLAWFDPNIDATTIGGFASRVGRTKESKQKTKSSDKSPTT